MSSTNFPCSLRKYIVEIRHSDANCFFQPSKAFNQLNYSNVPWPQNINFLWLKIKSPDFFLTLKNFSFPWHFLTGNLVSAIQYAYRYNNLLRLNKLWQRSVPNRNMKKQLPSIAFSKIRRAWSFHVAALSFEGRSFSVSPSCVTRKKTAQKSCHRNLRHVISRHPRRTKPKRDFSQSKCILMLQRMTTA